MLKAQFVAVESDTPFARTVRGMIYVPVVRTLQRMNQMNYRTSGGYNQGNGPQLEITVISITFT